VANVFTLNRVMQLSACETLIVSYIVKKFPSSCKILIHYQIHKVFIEKLMFDKVVKIFPTLHKKRGYQSAKYQQ
jgi:hypothetical protein